MSYQQAFHPDLDLVYSRFGATVTLEDVRRCAIDTFRDPRYRPGMRELVDFRNAIDVDQQLRFDTVREIWDSQSTWIQEMRGSAQVVLIGSTDLAFGLIRMYASLAGADSHRFNPCRDWNTACRLLGIDADRELMLASDEAEG